MPTPQGPLEGPVISANVDSSIGPSCGQAIRQLSVFCCGQPQLPQPTPQLSAFCKTITSKYVTPGEGKLQKHSFHFTWPFRKVTHENSLAVLNSSWGDARYCYLMKMISTGRYACRSSQICEQHHGGTNTLME